MRITPYEILLCLGFKVPPEGIDINLNESSLFIDTLCAYRVQMDMSVLSEAHKVNIFKETVRLMEEIIDVKTIPGHLLCDLHAGLQKIIQASQYDESHVGITLDSDMVDWLSALVESNQYAIECKRPTGNQLQQPY